MQRRQAAWGGAIVAAALAAATPTSGQTTERVSIPGAGGQASGGRYVARPAISADSTVVAFESPVSSLVPGDTNGVTDVFVWTPGGVTRVLGNGSAQSNCSSQRPSVSFDGRYIAFDSCASNLVAGDTNGLSDVFVYDRTSQTVTRVSVSSTETQGSGPSFSSAISPNGQYVAFLSQAADIAGGSGATHVFLRDIANGNTFLVSRADGVAGALATSDVRPSVSDNGTVAFASASGALASGDTNAVSDVFLRLGATGGAPTTVRVSLAADGSQLTSGSTRPSISADAQLVSFETVGKAVPADVNTLSDIYVRDLPAATTVLVSRTASGSGGNGNSFEASLSPNGGFVVFTSQAADFDNVFDAFFDVFRATLSRAVTPVAVTAVTRVSISQATTTTFVGGTGVNNAGLVVFGSDEPTLVAGDTNGDTDVFTSDGTTITKITATAANVTPAYSGQSLRPAPSYDGTIVAFLSSATNIVPGDTNSRTDVFVRNRVTGSTERLPVPAGFESLDADWVTISHDGRFVAYNRGASFLYDRFNGTTQTVSAASPQSAAVPGTQPRVSASGRYVVFLTNVSLDAADQNLVSDVYRFDRLTGAQVLVSRAATALGGNSATISADGKLVAFASASPTLVAGDANARTDVFVRDIDAGTNTRVSTNVDTQPTSIEARDPFISADGRYVTYLLSNTTLTSEASAASDVYVAASDAATPPRGPVNGANEGTGTAQGSYDPTLSMFGRFLAFRSYASDLVAPDAPTPVDADVFARVILGAAAGGAAPAPAFGGIQRLTVGSGGAEAGGGTGFDTENPEIAPNARSTVFQSGFSNLVTDDTNGMVDAFIRAGIFGNGECDFIEGTLTGYTSFANQHGLDPCSNAGSPFADPDGDGWTNDQERTGVGGDGNPLLGAFTRYFAEGATKTAGLNFDTRIALANPGSTVVTGEISYQLPSGVAVPVTPFTLQPFERKTVLLDEQPGIDEDGPDPSYEFSTTVRATGPIGVDRTMTWDKTTYSGHAETGVVSASRKWYFAEGATIGGFNLFYLLQNPSNAQVTVEGRFLLGTGAVHTKQFTLSPNSRFNIWANVEDFNGTTPLANAELSAEFTVTAGANIIAERAMYRGTSPLFKAGHESAGLTETATEWFLAEGNAGDFFDEFVLIGNTTGNGALVQADFIVGNTGTIYTKQYQVNPNSRFNIWVDEEELSGGTPFRTGNTDVSVRIRSLNGVPLIVERAMWWPGSSSTWYEAHNSPGSTRTASRWVVAEGEHGGPIGWNTYILVANTGSAAGSLRIRLLLPNGQTAVLTGQPVGAQSRTTYFLHDLLEAAGLPTDTQAGVLIESEGTTLPLVVERAMYRNVNGISFQVGTNALGNPLP
jgi:hypothetical protein